MSFKLAFNQPHFSINAFPTTTLPSFTLITGLNGSGKTHLLKAIDNGHVTVEGLINAQTEIKYFDWNSMVPNNESNFHSGQLDNEKQALFGAIKASYNQHRNEIIMEARDAGLPNEMLANPEKISKLSCEELAGILEDFPTARHAHQAIQKAVVSISKKMRRQLSTHSSHIFQIDLIERNSGLPIAMFDQDTISNCVSVSWGTVDVFQNSFAQLFVAYRDLLLRNNLLKIEEQEGNPDARPLSKVEFEQEYNIPPWKFLNNTLADAGLDFEIDRPEPNGFGAYTPKLRKKSSGIEINFNGLSSGEKILMSFASCLYYAHDTRQISVFPKILLLDEVDAPLHPSMTRNLIRIIKDILVGQYNIKVIATTHSPSTVAMAPDEAIHVMDADTPGVHKRLKSEALDLLTTGVPTLSIDFSGRRQVFVESATDAQIYDQIYTLTKPHLQSERSLAFMTTGLRKEGGDVNTGCVLVQKIVNDLKKIGNQSVFGLIDWDGKNNPTERIKVLAHGKRDGIENCLYDPLILACLIAGEAKAQREDIGLTKEGGAYEIKTYPPERLQQIVDKVQSELMGIVESTSSSRILCKYAGGLTLKISENLLSLDDHELESRVLAAIPSLKKHSKKAGGLLIHIAENILPDFPEFIPMDLIKSFSELLNARV